MIRIVKRTSLFVLVAMVSLSFARAENGTEARVSPQILTAKKAFLSNGGIRGNFGAIYSGGPNRPYDEFAADLKQWGKYQIVTNIEAADIVFDVSCDVNGPDRPQINLRIIDPKTHISMWTLNSLVQQNGGLQKSRDKGFDQAMNSLISDLKKLVEQPTPELQN